MKILSTLIFFLAFACTTKPLGTVKFEHQLFSLEYPNNWETLSEDGMILTISKFSKLKSIIKEENPNLVAVSQDSVHLLAYGINSFQDFLEGFKQNQLSKDNISLAEDFTTVNINGTQVELIKYRVQGEYLTFLQSQYSFRSMGQYVSLILTHEFGKPNNELTTIIESLEIMNIKPLEQLFEEPNND